VAELDAFGRSDVKAVKRTLSTAIDRHRSPYATHAEDHARHSILAGSVNGSNWLSDETGARRFYPVKVGQIRLDLVRENRQQYIAEGVALILAGDLNWYTIPVDEAKRERDARYEDDVWHDAIEYRTTGLTHVTIPDLLGHLDIPVQQRDKRAQLRVAACLTRLGFRRFVGFNPDEKKTFKGWRR
jgi:predicted P-loop ATPase